jgi:hypothetical protein
MVSVAAALMENVSQALVANAVHSVEIVARVLVAVVRVQVVKATDVKALVVANAAKPLLNYFYKIDMRQQL